MTKNEKEKSLNKYLSELKTKRERPIPSKHQSHPDTYIRFLDNEIKMTTSVLEKLKIQ